MTTLPEPLHRQTTTLRDGEYNGTWGGYFVTLDDGTQIRTTTGIRTPAYPVTVVVASGNVSIFPRREKRDLTHSAMTTQPKSPEDMAVAEAYLGFLSKLPRIPLECGGNAFLDYDADGGWIIRWRARINGNDHGMDVWLDSPSLSRFPVPFAIGEHHASKLAESIKKLAIEKLS